MLSKIIICAAVYSAQTTRCYRNGEIAWNTQAIKNEKTFSCYFRLSLMISNEPTVLCFHINYFYCFCDFLSYISFGRRFGKYVCWWLLFTLHHMHIHSSGVFLHSSCRILLIFIIMCFSEVKVIVHLRFFSNIIVFIPYFDYSFEACIGMKRENMLFCVLHYAYDVVRYNII